MASRFQPGGYEEDDDDFDDDGFCFGSNADSGISRPKPFDPLAVSFTSDIINVDRNQLSLTLIVVFVLKLFDPYIL